MAQLPVIANVIRCAMSGVCPNGQPWVNTFHVEKEPAAAYAAAITAIEAEVVKIYSTAVPYGAGTQSWHAGASTAAQWRKSSYTPLDGVTASTVFNHATSGLNVATPMPSDCAVAVSEKTAKRGPRYRGRFYLAGYTESINDTGGVITEASRLEMQAAWVAWANALFAHADLGGLVVASYKFATAEPITNVGINNQWDRQNRRK